MIDRLIDSSLSTKDHQRLSEFYDNHRDTSYYDIYDFINHYFTLPQTKLLSRTLNLTSFDDYINKFNNEQVKAAIVRNYLELFLEYCQYVNYHNTKIVHELNRLINVVADQDSIDIFMLMDIYSMAMRSLDIYPEELLVLDIFKSKNFSKALVSGKIIAHRLSDKKKMMKVCLKPL